MATEKLKIRPVILDYMIWFDEVPQYTAGELIIKREAPYVSKCRPINVHASVTASVPEAEREMLKKYLGIADFSHTAHFAFGVMGLHKNFKPELKGIKTNTTTYNKRINDTVAEANRWQEETGVESVVSMLNEQIRQAVVRRNKEIYQDAVKMMTDSTGVQDMLLKRHPELAEIDDSITALEQELRDKRRMLQKGKNETMLADLTAENWMVNETKLPDEIVKELSAIYTSNGAFHKRLF